MGHDAGSLSLNLLSTLGGRSEERLVDGHALSEWLVAQGLVDRSFPVDGDNVYRARTLRTALLALVEAELSGERPSGADVAAINAAAAVPEHAPGLRLGPRGLERVPDRPRFAEILGLVARDAIELLTGPSRELLRECAAQDCRGIYVDTSQGRRRRWCSAARCGNRARVAAHRARHVVAVGTEHG